MSKTTSTPNFRLPSTEALRHIMTLVRKAVFPEIYGAGDVAWEIGHLLATEIGSDEQAAAVVGALPELRRTLLTDTQAVIQADPAAQSFEEVVLSYPSVVVMLHYRLAHYLHRAGIPLLPLILITKRR